MMSKEKMAVRFILVVVGISIAASLVGAEMNSGLPAVEVADLADGNADDVLGHDGAGVAVSQSRDGVRVTHLSAITITTATNTILPFNSELFDDNDLHDTVTNNSRLTAVVEGRYFISAAVSWDTVVTGTREIHIKLNGTGLIGLRKSKATEADLFVQGLSIIYNLAADDYVEVEVFHSRGSNLNINSVGDYTPIFMMQRLRSQ